MVDSPIKHRILYKHALYCLTAVFSLLITQVYNLSPRGIVVKFNSNDLWCSAAENSAADVLRKFVVVVILPETSFLYLFSFLGKLAVFAMV